MNDIYEKLGAFYLGKTYDPDQGKLSDTPLLYDAKDLTTHAVIIGMTGSGKTGLGIGLIEEALIDNIPVIAIDPKGDLPNLMLTFPELAPDNFLPWINREEALAKGVTPEQHARNTAAMWRKGLSDWDQAPERISRLKQAADVAVYTPGSTAGRQVNVLRSFAPPAPVVMNDPDLLKDKIQTTTTILLSLLGIDADPITSPEHILLANIFEKLWSDGKTPDLGTLIQTIQKPPFQQIGVMDLETVFPAKERFGLAMRLNNLLAAPGFEAWMSGEPLDISAMLHTDKGKPRASIFTLNHLSEAERMFFVSTLLNEILSWMRSQPGTSSLRALIYMDEIFGYFPPIRNPPSKQPLLTLLKQARAYGLGIVLSTQNPVDLDYKGLSNTGTWMIGRLQTEQDKQRVLSGLQNVASEAVFDSERMNAILSGLEKRVFLMHNVHEETPEIFHTRWVLSYLSGPMTREQIKALTGNRPDSVTPADAFVSAGDAAISVKQAPVSAGVSATTAGAAAGVSQPVGPPAVPPGIDTYYLRPTGTGHDRMYVPTVLGRMDIHYSSARYKVETSRTITAVSKLVDGPVPLDWDNAFIMDVELDAIEESPRPDFAYAGLPGDALNAKVYVKWNRNLKRWVIQNQPLTLFKSQQFKCISELDESEGDFRARLALKVREERDLEVEKIRRRYESKFRVLQNRLLRAEQAISREKEQAKSQKLRTAISFGTALLSSFLGRKKVSATSARSFGTAMKSANRIRKETMDINRAKALAERTRRNLEEMELQLQDDIQQIESRFDPAEATLEEISIKPRSTGVNIEVFGLTWMPVRRNIDGSVREDFFHTGSES